MAFINLRFADRSFVLDDANGSDLVARQMLDGYYEAPLPMLTLAILVRSPGLFLDVGANNGLYSILAAKSRPEIKVEAFEPFSPVLEVLKRNIEANALTDRVKINPIALSNEEGVATLYLPDQSHGLLETSCSLEATFKPLSETLEVKKNKLDNISFSEPISLIKADIEGHELSFLEGARKTIARDRPFIFAEVLPIAGSTLTGLTTFIQQMGYMDFALRKEVAIHSEFVRHDPLAWNHAFVPRDRLENFEIACTAHQIRLARDW